MGDDNFQMIEQKNMSSCAELVAFYDNAEIFITGGSGVVGKALIDKLLRSCNPKRIFLLLRPRKHLNVEARLAKLKMAKIFNVLRTETPELLERLIAVPGDVSLPLLGIDPNDLVQMRNVSMVFHCAATIRFDEPLKVALQLNVGGTLEALKFAETLRKLKIFVHVSTFYSNPYLDFVQSKIYESPMDWRFCLKLLENCQDEEMLDALTKKMIVGFPNTYTFTKNLAESLVKDYCNRLPIVIYRPSIVLFSLREPEPGFAPALVGAMGLFTLVGAGILKTVYLADHSRLDITPQDIGIKTMMHSAHEAYKIYQQQKGPCETALVYQSSSCTHSTYTFPELANFMEDYNLWMDAAFEKCLLIPGCHYTSSRLVYMFLVFIQEILPALLADLLLRLFGRKPVVMSVVRKAFITLEVMQPFMFNNYESLGTSDMSLMINRYAGTEFDVAQDFQHAHSKWHMVELCEKMVRSIRKDLLNEHPNSVPRAQIVQRIKRLIYFLIRAYLFYKVVLWIFGNIF